MGYQESADDRRLRAIFENDMRHANLRRISLSKGSLRGLTNLDLDINYPIVAIAGKNGAGKSTVLAIAACAFHNSKTGFKLAKRASPYYTFSDFFIQHKDEVSPQGIEIRYAIAYDNWKPVDTLPKGVGIGNQIRKKKKGGKWNDYASRVHRNVVFLGIERVVPHYERSQSRSYSRVFKSSKEKGWEARIREDVGFILNKKYDELRFLEHSKYSLPIVRCGKTTYSGFNMGAGENALFEIFSALYSSGPGSLIVLDEIELGLHAEAQRRLIDRLKETCRKNFNQIICTTHSREIFQRLPPDARFFVESINGKTKVTPQISSEFAFAKMKSSNSQELDVLVEDDVAKAILLAALPAEVRTRVVVRVIGSATAVSRQLAAAFVRNREDRVIAILDGDQRALFKDNYSHALSMTEGGGEDFQNYFKERVGYMPGDTWPESWLVSTASACLADVCSALNCEKDSLHDALEYGLQAGKHNEVFEVSKHLGLEKGSCLQGLAMAVAMNKPAALLDVVSFIEGALEANS